MENVKLDLIPGRVMPICHASQYDVGRVIRFNLVENDVPYVLDGTETVTFDERKIDGNVVTAACTVTASKSYVDVETTEQMCACYGQNLCELKIEKGDVLIGSLNFVLDVERDPLEGGIQSESEIYNLQVQVTAMANAAVAEAMSGYDIYGAYVTEQTSSAIASFTDGADNVPVKALSVEFAASQDLHGQSAPYPAGGSAQLWDEQWEVGGYNNTTGGKTSETDRIRNKNNIVVGAGVTLKIVYPTSLSGGIYVHFWNSNDEHIGVDYAQSSNNFTITTPANTAYIKFNTQSYYGNTYHNNISINYPASDTAYHPYSNICPITPVNAINVTRTGKNLFSSVFADYTKDGSYYECPITLKQGVTYKIGATLVGTAITGILVGIAKGGSTYPYDGQKTVINTSGTILNQSAFTVDETWTAPKLLIYCADGTAFNNIFVNYNIQLEVGSTATTYEAYNGVTKTLNLGGDYYGGEVDALSGEITENYGLLDLGSVNWENATTSSTEGRLVQTSPIITTGIPSSQMPDLLCEIYEPKKGDAIYGGVVGIGINVGGKIRIFDTRFLNKTNAEVKTMLSGYYVKYPLATPVTAQSSNAIELNTLLGNNAIFSDAGDVDVTYRADTALYIDKRLNA